MITKYILFFLDEDGESRCGWSYLKNIREIFLLQNVQTIFAGHSLSSSVGNGVLSRR
jgi:hypothetical protein